MKYIINKAVLLGILILAYSSCKKDTKNEPVLSYANASVTLTSTATTAIVLDSANSGSNVVSFSWDSAKLGYSYGSSFTLQFDVPGDSFKTPQTLVVSGYNANILGSNLNTFCNLISLLDSTSNIIFGTNVALDVRLKVTLTQENVGQGSVIVAPIYSNIVALTVNPYYVPVPFSYIWVVGDYMNWTWPPSGVNLADSLASVKSDGNYEGFVNITGGTGTDQFKLVPALSWNEAFALSTTISTSGNVTTIPMNTLGGTSNNLQVPSNGYYYMQADTNLSNQELTATLVNSFSIIGTATGNVAIPLTYNTSANDWTAAGVSLSAGTVKFVINNGDASQVSFGASNVVNHVKNGGPGVSVATAGTYNVILNMSLPGNYTDTLSN